MLPQKYTSVQNNHLRFHTMPSKKMVRSYCCLNVSSYKYVKLVQHLRCSVIQDSNIDIECNKRLDRQRPCFEDELTAGSNLQYKVTYQLDAVVVVQYFVLAITSSLV